MVESVTLQERVRTCYQKEMRPLGVLFGNVLNITVQQIVMWFIGAALIYLAIKKDMEPALLLPIGFGAILVNLPMSGAVTRVIDGVAEIGVLDTLFEAGIANELFPLLLFIGIGAMIDFGPLLSNPKMLLFGAAAQFGIFFTLSMAALFGFDLKDAACIAIIGAADGPTSIFVANFFQTKYVGAIVVAAYSYMALVPIIQPPVIRLITTRKERRIRMPYNPRQISRGTKILFPIVITVLAGVVAPRSVALIGFLMFGNLIRECGVLNLLSETAQKVLANLITLFLGITIAARMQADQFLNTQTLLILALGMFAFVFDTVGGVLFAKLLNLFARNKINPMVGAAGISAFPMSARVIHKMGQKEDDQNFLLMHATGANVAGQIASVIAGGMIMNLIAR
jgi:oxaloacetate decarboxylase beta subunit